MTFQGQIAWSQGPNIAQFENTDREEQLLQRWDYLKWMHALKILCVEVFKND